MICIFLKNFSRLAEPALEIKPARPILHARILCLPSPYQRRTNSTPSPLHPRISERNPRM